MYPGLFRRGANVALKTLTSTKRSQLTSAISSNELS